MEGDIFRHKILRATPRGKVVETLVGPDGDFVLYRDHLKYVAPLEAELAAERTQLQKLRDENEALRAQVERLSALGKVEGV